MKTLVVYLMAGRGTPELAEAAVAGGADIVELGFPFSDPLADGPVIRRAAERALADGMRTRRCLECLAETRARVEVPLIPMTYASLLEAYGYERFAADAHAAGATSLIVADLPAGERPELRRVQLVAPTSTDAESRLRRATRTAGSTWSPSPGRPGPASASPLRSRASSPGPGRSPTCRSTPGSGSRHRSRPPRPPSSPTGSSSARARSRSPRTGLTRSTTTSRRCVPPSAPAR